MTQKTVGSFQYSLLDWTPSITQHSKMSLPILMLPGVSDEVVHHEVVRLISLWMGWTKLIQIGQLPFHSAGVTQTLLGIKVRQCGLGVGGGGGRKIRTLTVVNTRNKSFRDKRRMCLIAHTQKNHTQAGTYSSFKMGFKITKNLLATMRLF